MDGSSGKDDIVNLLTSLLEEQRTANAHLKRLTVVLGAYAEAMVDRLYKIEGEPVLQVWVKNFEKD